MGPGAPYETGFDTPELRGKKCGPKELPLARKATARMAELIQTPGLVIENSGQVDSTESKRPLVWLRLPDGRTIGEIMIDEGLARVWPDGHKFWCE